MIRPDDAATLAKGVQEMYAEAETLLLQRIANALAAGSATTSPSGRRKASSR